MSETPRFKHWEDLDITDDFIFSRVMLKKKLCLNPMTRSARRAASQLASPTEVLRVRHSFAVPPPEKPVVSRTDNYLRCNQTISVTNSLEKKSFPTYLL